jgi:hypothetical protein
MIRLCGERRNMFGIDRCFVGVKRASHRWYTIPTRVESYHLFARQRQGVGRSRWLANLAAAQSCGGCNMPTAVRSSDELQMVANASLTQRNPPTLHLLI